MTPFRPQWVKDLAEEVPETLDWLVHGLLPKGTLGLLAAYPKVGKSTLAYQLAVAVAQGREFLGRQASHPGGVLIIVVEERKDDAMRRLREFGMTETDPICLWIETVADTPADQTKICQFISDQDIALIIIDTLATYLMLQDETDNSAVTRRLKPYLDMAHTTGTTILFVHHERKNRDEGGDDTRAIRGGGAILGLADLAFQLQKGSGGPTRRRLKIVGRYHDIPRSLELDYKDDEYISLGAPEEHTRAAHRGKVLAVLPINGPGLTAKEVATKTGLKEKAVRTALEDAHSCGSAGRSGVGKKGDPFRYLRVSESADAPALVPAIGDTNEKEVAEV